MSEVNIDLTEIDRDQLLDLYYQLKNLDNDDFLKVGHRIFCLDHGDVPENFSNIFVSVLEKREALSYVKSLSENEIKFKRIILESIIDSIYSDFRSIFLEHEKYNKNYTLINAAKLTQSNLDKMITKLTSHDPVEGMSKIFDEKRFINPLLVNYSFRDLIKLITDKSVAHRDNITDDYREILEKRYDFLNDDSVTNYEITKYLFDAHNIYKGLVEKYADMQLSYKVMENLTR